MHTVIGALFPIVVTLALGFFAGMVMTKQSELTGNFGLAAVIAAAMVRAQLVTLLIARFVEQRGLGRISPLPQEPCLYAIERGVVP